MHLCDMKFEYPAKVIMAWGEAISGNKELRQWLIQNGYPELGLFVFALHNKDEARNWLLQNRHEHLMALINGAEGNPNALVWLKKFGFDVLEKMARGADNEDGAITWLVSNGYGEMAGVSIRIRNVKNQIEADNNDVHKISAE